MTGGEDAVTHQPLDAMHHGGSLARAGHGKDQRRAVVVLDDGLLLFGQSQGHASDCITAEAENALGCFHVNMARARSDAFYFC